MTSSSPATGLLPLVVAVLAAIPAQAAPGGNPAADIVAESRMATPIAARKAEEDVVLTRAALAATPDVEAAAQNLIDALTRAGRKREALAEADRFADKRKTGAQLRAQRAFLRRDLNDWPGASADFTEALAGEGLTPEQRRNVEAGLAEVKASLFQSELDRAQRDFANGKFADAADGAKAILAKTPASEPAMMIRVDSLTRAGKKREALTEATQFSARAPGNALLRAQLGFLRREMNDPQGAADDFKAALTGKDLNEDQRRNLEAGLKEADVALTQVTLTRADFALKGKQYADASSASLKALERDPRSASAAAIHIEALSGLGRKREAAAAADRFIAANPDSVMLRAQRGYLRRELNDIPGAIADFNAALTGPGLSRAQRRGLEAAITEARNSEKRSAVERAQRESGQHAGWVYAERGYARRKAGDAQGAVADFDAALARHDLSPAATREIRYARAEAAATVAEANGDPLQAEASYRDYLESEPGHADGWYKLGYLMLSRKQPRQGADALGHGLEIRPVATAYLDSANASILTNAPLASRNYRTGLDHWFAGDRTLTQRSAIDLERVKNEVVEADASVRTSITAGGIGGRPEGGGGNNNAGGIDTRVRFDGRYLPTVLGLEAFARGLTGKDSTGARETTTGAGLRYRPISDLNFYLGGMVDHAYQPRSETEFVALWGLGLGSDAYPYITGWRPYWDAGTFGSWHTSQHRVLQDTRGNVGFLYETRAPVRAAIGPTLLGVASYDSLAATPWAAGVGPSLLSYVWLGGDKYRSYDAIVTMQVGYLFNVGADQRLRGWRGQVAVTF